MSFKILLFIDAMFQRLSSFIVMSCFFILCRIDNFEHCVE